MLTTIHIHNCASNPQNIPSEMYTHLQKDAQDMHVEEKGHKLEASMVYIVRSLSQNINKG